MKTLKSDAEKQGFSNYLIIFIIFFLKKKSTKYILCALVT